MERPVDDDWTSSVAVATAAAARTTAAAAAAVATTTAAAESTAAAAAAAGLAGFSSANGEGATALLRAVQTLDSGLPSGSVAHGDETEAAAATGLAIGDDLRALDVAKGSEETLKARVVDRPGEISNVEFQDYNLNRRLNASADDVVHVGESA